MTPQNIGVHVGSKIPNVLLLSIQRAISNGKYLNLSDFIRDAIKEKIDREGLITMDNDLKNRSALNEAWAPISNAESARTSFREISQNVHR
jgi:Arc/MetJ-type ribon-helix-helix transcriptional regulator